MFLSIVSPLFTVSRSRGDGVVHAGIRCGGDNDREQSTALRETHNTDSAFVGLTGHRVAVAYLFDLFRYNIMVGDVGDVPGVPDEAANGEHRDFVTQCVTKSRGEH